MGKARSGLELIQRGIKPLTRYKVIISGEAFVKAHKGTAHYPYRVAFTTSEKNCRETTAVFQFVNKVAPRVMPQRVPGYLGLATHNLESCTVIGGGELQNPDLMTRAELAVFAVDLELDIDLMLYPDRVDLLNAVKECLEDPESFEKNQEARRARKSKSLALQSNLDELNAEGVEFLGFGEEPEENEYDKQYMRERIRQELENETAQDKIVASQDPDLIVKGSVPPKPVSNSEDQPKVINSGLEIATADLPPPASEEVEEAAFLEVEKSGTDAPESEKDRLRQDAKETVLKQEKEKQSKEAENKVKETKKGNDLKNLGV